MSKALSVDLRERVLAAVGKGAPHREVADRFGVSAASVSRWRQLQKRQGHLRPGPLGGDRYSHRIEGHSVAILAWLAGHRDATLADLREAMADKGIVASQTALHRFLVRHDQTRKKRLAMP